MFISTYPCGPINQIHRGNKKRPNPSDENMFMTSWTTSQRLFNMNNIAKNINSLSSPDHISGINILQGWNHCWAGIYVNYIHRLHGVSVFFLRHSVVFCPTPHFLTTRNAWSPLDRLRGGYAHLTSTTSHFISDWWMPTIAAYGRRFHCLWQLMKRHAWQRHKAS